MASGPDPARSLLDLSHVANTVMTRTIVMSSSITNPCMGETPFPRVVIPAEVPDVSDRS